MIALFMDWPAAMALVTIGVSAIQVWLLDRREARAEARRDDVIRSVTRDLESAQRVANTQARELIDVTERLERLEKKEAGK